MKDVILGDGRDGTLFVDRDMEINQSKSYQNLFIGFVPIWMRWLPFGLILFFSDMGLLPQGSVVPYLKTNGHTIYVKGKLRITNGNIIEGVPE